MTTDAQHEVIANLILEKQQLERDIARLSALESVYDQLAEAREKIKRQAERIRKLEGPTNHAGGL